MAEMKWKLERMRDRVMMLPRNVQVGLTWAGGLIFLVAAVVVESVLHGAARTVFYGIALVLTGVLATLAWQNRDSRR